MINPISVLKMVDLFEYAEKNYRGGRYGSVHCFSDDVLEVLAITERPLPSKTSMVELCNVRPGQFEFVTVTGAPYTITICSTGATVLRPGHRLEKSQFQIPYATLSIKKAEREKGVAQGTWSGLGNPIFAALRGKQDSLNPCDRNMLIAFILEGDEWGMAVDNLHHLGLWAKKCLCCGSRDSVSYL